MDENNYTTFSQLTNLNENILESDNFVDDFDWSKDLEKYLKFAEEQQNIQSSSTFNQPRPIFLVPVPLLKLTVLKMISMLTAFLFKKILKKLKSREFFRTVRVK